ncbi:MAG: DUF47 domain-containing protein [bacterium]|nr:DUF47 domain-containing protein [bacterium]
MEDKSTERISQIVTSTAQKIGETLTQLAQKIGKETGKLARIATLKAEIFKLQNDRKSKLEELGEKLLKLYKENALAVVNLESFKDTIDSILNIEKEIELKNLEIKKIQEEEKISDEEVSQIPMG